MSAPFWIHCNMCNALLKKENNHYMLSCTHILCKNCMQQTNGKKCTLCNSDIRFEDVSKLPDKLKKNFEPNIKKSLKEVSKVIKFQKDHTRNVTKLTCDYKKKNRLLEQVYDKELAETMKLKKQLDDFIKQRRLMQEKLKEVYIRNQRKQQHEIYRNPHNSTLSFEFPSEKTAQNSGRSIDVGSDFFNESTEMGKDFNSSDFFAENSNDFFGSSSAKTHKRQKQIDHTQSDRSPFFA